MMIGVAQVIGMKPTLRSFFSMRAALREHFGRGLEREELRDRGERGRGADRFQECAARGVLRKHRPHHRGGDDAFVALVFAFDRRALQSRRGVAFMLDLAGMAAAGAAGAVQPRFGSKGLSNVDIGTPPSLPPRQRRGGAAMILQWPCQSTGAARRDSPSGCVCNRGLFRPLPKQMPKLASDCQKRRRPRVSRAAASSIPTAEVGALLRHHPVAADVDAGRLQRAVRLLGRGHDR